jgi:hypothetical protein
MFENEGGKPMIPKIHVSLNFNKPDTQVVADAVGYYDGLKGNPAFVNPPIPLDVFKAAIDTFVSAIAIAADGGRKAIIERKKHRTTLIKMVRQLGHWVEANCKEDLGIFGIFESSGFPAASNTRTPAAPLPLPVILKVEHGTAPGQIVIKVKPIPKALSYEVHYASNGADGKPGSWTLLPPFTSSRPFTVKGLTPSTTYSFQVRALGKTGYAEWTHSATRMSL